MVSGKINSGANRSPLVDIILVLDVSGSTAKYAGVDFPEVAELANFYLYPGRGRYYGVVTSGPLNKRNSIFAAEILASRRLLSQLDPETTRVGVITFGDGAWLRAFENNGVTDVEGVEDDAARLFGEPDVDRLDPLKTRRGQVDVKRQVVMIGDDGRGEALGAGRRAGEQAQNPR